MKLGKITDLVLVVMLLFVITSNSAQAYLDPGTGSLIFQILIAGLLGGILAVKSSLFKIKNITGKIFGRKKKSGDEGSS